MRTELQQQLGGVIAEYVASFVAAASEATPSNVSATSASDSSGHEYGGVAFSFYTGNAGTSQQCTALMVDIARLFTRVQRYTAQAAKRIIVGEKENAGTNVELFTIKEDEREIFRQFLKDGSDMVWRMLYGYVRDAKFRGYLFDYPGAINLDSASFPIDIQEGDKVVAPSYTEWAGKCFQALEYMWVENSDEANFNETSRWKEVSPLYNTSGSVVYFFSEDSEQPYKGNVMLALLTAIEDFLYSYVLWQWYFMCNVEHLAGLWQGTVERNKEAVLSVSPWNYGIVKRRISPW